MAACPTCGLDEAAIAIPDAVQALRSFPRRWREVLDGPASREHPGALTQPAANGSPAALELAAHTTVAFERLLDALEQAMVHDGAELPALPEPAPVPADAGDGEALSGATAAARLGAAATALAERAGRVATTDWTRTVLVGGVERHAAWLVQHAAHVGAHHLREAERAIAAHEAAGS